MHQVSGNLHLEENQDVIADKSDEIQQVIIIGIIKLEQLYWIVESTVLSLLFIVSAGAGQSILEHVRARRGWT